MADQADLQFIIKMQDQASAVIKQLGSSIGGLAKIAKTGTEAINESAKAQDAYGAASQEVIKHQQLASRSSSRAKRGDPGPRVQTRP